MLKRLCSFFAEFRDKGEKLRRTLNCGIVRLGVKEAGWSTHLLLDLPENFKNVF